MARFALEVPFKIQACRFDGLYIPSFEPYLPGEVTLIAAYGHPSLFPPDINECVERFSCPLEATCENTEGSHECNCPVGYRHSGNTCAGSQFVCVCVFLNQERMSSLL